MIISKQTETARDVFSGTLAVESVLRTDWVKFELKIYRFFSSKVAKNTTITSQLCAMFLLLRSSSYELNITAVKQSENNCVISES